MIHFGFSNNDEFCKYFLKVPSFQMNGCASSGHKYDTRSNAQSDDLWVAMLPMVIVTTCVLYRLLAEELRKVFIALWEESNCIYSPDSLVSVILKIIPQFR